MPRVTTDEHGRLILADDFLQRRHIRPGTEYWLDEREGDLILHPRLPDIRKLYIEPTTACNLNCRTCIRNVWEDPQARMSMKTFRRIVESLEALPDLKRVIFTGFGEPLVHSDILEMIAAVRERGLAVTLGSNGLLLNSEISRELVRLGVERVVISVDGVKPETYAGIRGATLSQVLDNIRGLNEAKRQMGSLYPALGIEFVALKSNLDELAQLTGLATHLNAARVLVSNVLAYSEDMRAEMLYGYEPRPPFMAQGWPVRADAWVMWGTAEIWMSEAYTRFRSEVRGFHFPSCPNCDLRASCDLRDNNNGCWGWNPSCADCLWAQDIVRCP